jgi:hypothetical protein
MGSALDMARHNVADRAALLQRGVQRIDRSTGNTEGDNDTLLLEDTHCGIDRSHLRHFEPRLTNGWPGAIIVADVRDLNETEFVSRDVEWSAKNDDRSDGWLGRAVKPWDSWALAIATRLMALPLVNHRQPA